MTKQLNSCAKLPLVNIFKKEDLSLFFKDINLGKVQVLLLLCSCMCMSKSACLYKCADDVSYILDKELSDSSYYQILIRFFRTGKGEAILEGIFRFIVYLLWIKGEGKLLLDRTNWECGKQKIVNLLVVGIVYKGVFIPLVWQDLSRAGNSSTKERLALVDKLLSWWQRSGLELPTLYIVGDREFVGKKWLIGLQRRNICYVMRLKANRRFDVWCRYKKGENRKVKLSVIRRWLQRYDLDYAEIVIDDEIIANIVIRELEHPQNGQKYLYLITNVDSSELASKLYRVRWQIETCFKHLKSNGFNLEDMSMKQEHKVELMFGVIALTYTLAIREGVIAYEQDKKKGKKMMKTYKSGKQTVKKSIFRKGLSRIKAKVFNLERCFKYILGLFDEIRCKIQEYNIKHIKIT